MTSHRVGPFLLVLPAFCEAAQPIVDGKSVEPEILSNYSSLIKLDTSNPPGNETIAAKYLQGVLEKDGIPSQLFSLEPDRANVVARIKGNGSKKPLLIMGHTDVVGVQREKWTVDPFSAIRKDGYIYGRGSIDDKDKATECLTVMLMLKRLKVPLVRGVVFLAEAGEEGTSRVGIEYMVNQHWDEISSEYALTEGGGGVARGGGPLYLSLSPTEKMPRRGRLVAHRT